MEQAISFVGLGFHVALHDVPWLSILFQALFADVRKLRVSLITENVSLPPELSINNSTVVGEPPQADSRRLCRVLLTSARKTLLVESMIFALHVVGKYAA